MSLNVRHAPPRPQPHEATAREFLEIVAGENTTPEALREFARAWGIGLSDVKAVESKLNAANALDVTQAGATITRASYGVAHALRLAAGLAQRQESIQTAEPDQLLEWLEFYEAQTDALYQQAVGMPDSTERLEVMAKLERLSGFWWECRERSGLHDLLERGEAS